MNKRFLNVGAALSVFLLASCFFVGCGDDGSSATNVDDAVSSSSSVENLSLSVMLFLRQMLCLALLLQRLWLASLRLSLLRRL